MFREAISQFAGFLRERSNLRLIRKAGYDVIADSLRTKKFPLFKRPSQSITKLKGMTFYNESKWAPEAGYAGYVSPQITLRKNTAISYAASMKLSRKRQNILATSVSNLYNKEVREEVRQDFIKSFRLKRANALKTERLYKRSGIDSSFNVSFWSTTKELREESKFYRDRSLWARYNNTGFIFASNKEEVIIHESIHQLHMSNPGASIFKELLQKTPSLKKATGRAYYGYKTQMLESVSLADAKFIETSERLAWTYQSDPSVLDRITKSLMQEGSGNSMSSTLNRSTKNTRNGSRKMSSAL